MRDVAVTSGVLAGCRRAALLCVPVLALLAPASAAQAQRLLTLVPGVGQAASVGDLGPSIGPVPTAVQVDLELLRGAPIWLEVPTPDGSVLSAEQSVFEDRGGGDLMWSGGQPGAGYDTVVLTVEGGRLVGRFGAAGGGAYQIHAERDGRGGMAPLGGSGPDGPVPLCGVDAGTEDGHDAHAHAVAGAFAADPPRRVSNPQSHDRLEILVAYTATAAENWADRGGALAAIRHAVDYMKMVFRNNRIEVEPHLVHVVQASAAFDRAGRDLGRHLYGPRPLLPVFAQDGDLLRLHHEHRADFVHLFTGERVLLLGACGSASLLGKYTTVQGFLAKSWSTNHPLFCPDYARTFVHEIGHGLGANHDPANSGVADPFRPYAFGHADLDVMPSLGTAMSYRGQIEPFFSTPRLRPWGAVLGIADERDNERTLQETVHIAVRYGDYLPSLDPAPPSDVRVRFEAGAARLTWRDNAPDADRYEVQYWYTARAGLTSRNHMIKGRTGAVLPLESTEPGTHYFFYVRAVKGDERSLRGNVPVLIVPGEPIAAPSDVSATFEGVNHVQVRWTDNSDNESGFDVQLLQDGEPIHRNSVAADTEYSSFADWSVRVQGGAEYGVRVFAFSPSGYSVSSEVASFRWQHPRAPGPVTGVSARAIGPTTVRLAWTAEVARFQIEASLSRNSWRDRRFWGGSRDGVTAWEDFEGLARGGRYGFRILPTNGVAAGVAAWVYLTLGERGTGPRAPSDLDWVLEGNRVRLSWKDNSSDERGFEVQVDVGHFFSGELKWQRLLTVPADTESAVSDLPLFDGQRRFRVFAYNDRGYSVDSSRVQELPRFGSLIATAGDAEVRLGWRLYSAETVTGMQVRWKASAALPFDDALDAWTDLPAAAREYTVTGLRNDTEYTFAVRALSASGAGPAETVTATPRGPPEASFRLDIPCDEELCRTFTDAPVSFTDTSTGNVTERRWSFGDGAASDLRSPTHAWSTPGFYDVTLTVSDGSSADSASRTVLVAGRRLAASFRLDIPCEEDLCRTFTDAPVSFVDTSGGNVTEWRWSFGDGARSDLRSPTHAWSTPGFYDVTLTVGDGSSSDSATRVVLVEAAAPAGSCRFDEETICLRDSRFEVKANWWSADGESGPGRVVYAGTNDSGLFRFFDPLNWEILIKVLDGCGINGRIWVLGAATTDLGYRILVTDTVTGESRSYVNEPGRPAPAIVDTEAFSLPCRGGAGP